MKATIAMAPTTTTFTERKIKNRVRRAYEALSPQDQPVGIADYRRWVATQPRPHEWPTLEDIESAGFTSWIAVSIAVGGNPKGRGAIPVELINQAIQKAFDETAETRGDAPFIRADYERWRSRNRKYPTLRHTPDWKALCARAGIDEGLSGVNHRPMFLSNEGILNDLKAAAEMHGRPLSAASYQRWRSVHSGAALSTVQERFGSWTAAAAQAGVGQDRRKR